MLMAFSDTEALSKATQAPDSTPLWDCSRQRTLGPIVCGLVWTSQWEMRHFLFAACSHGVQEVRSCSTLRLSIVLWLLPALHQCEWDQTLRSGVREI